MSEEIICLSDSEESLRSATNGEPNGGCSDEDVDFSFPAVEFTYHVNDAVNAIDEKQCDKNINNKSVQTSTSITRSKAEHSKSAENLRERPENFQNKQFSSTAGKDKEKEASESSKEIRAERAVTEKLLKALERKNLKKIQPGECLKLMHLRLDRGLMNFGFHACIIDALANTDSSWELETLPVANSIMWMRKTEEHYMTDSNELYTKEGRETEKQMIVIFHRKEVVRRIVEQSFLPALKDVSNVIPGAQLTLILYGMKEYFSEVGGAPKISRQDLEIHLADIQLSLNCASQLVDTREDLGSLVCRFTKSIAEIPYKLENSQKLAEKLNWYATGDNRDTVRVDKSGNGLGRLWQQQLCQFNLASLETAEAISSVYPSPLCLMEAYRKCMGDEGEKLLNNIPIRRAAGALSTVRKVGPELSKKIFVMFTSKNGEETLCNKKEV